MKNSDMKVIAIILSIALLFTIITSNAVSIVSVILLSNGGMATSEAVDGEGTGDAADSGVSSGTPSSSSSSGSGSSSSSSGSSSSSSGSSSSSSGSSSSGSTDAGNAGGDAGAAGSSDIEKDPLAAFQKASKEIHDQGVAGYKKIGWQAVEGNLQLSKFDFLSGTLTNLIKGFMTEKDAAEVKDNAKGSDDAKNRMPAGDCSKSYVKSATAAKEGDNFVVTIVMNDQVNPSYADSDGLVKMSKEFLDINDVKKTVTEDETVSKIVSKVDGTINYKAYTITATMNAQGQFIKIVHYGVGDINADVTAVGVGDLQASGALSFNAEYYDFVY